MADEVADPVRVAVGRVEVVIGRYLAPLLIRAFVIWWRVTRGVARFHTAEVRGSSPFAPTA